MTDFIETVKNLIDALTAARKGDCFEASNIICQTDEMLVNEYLDVTEDQELTLRGLMQEASLALNAYDSLEGLRYRAKKAA